MKVHYYCSHHPVRHVSQVLMLHSPDLHSAVCQSYLNETGRREQEKFFKPTLSVRLCQHHESTAQVIGVRFSIFRCTQWSSQFQQWSSQLQQLPFEVIHLSLFHTRHFFYITIRSSFRIWNSSTWIPSPPLALFAVMLPKAHLTLHSRMSDSRWVIPPSWLSVS